MDGQHDRLLAGFRDRAGITFIKAEKRPFKPTVRVVGTVAFNPSYVAAIGTRLRGTVRRTFKYEGDRVARERGARRNRERRARRGAGQRRSGRGRPSRPPRSTRAREQRASSRRGSRRRAKPRSRRRELATQRRALQAAQQRVNAFGGRRRPSASTSSARRYRRPRRRAPRRRPVSPSTATSAGYKVADLAHLWIELSVFERDLARSASATRSTSRPLSAPTKHRRPRRARRRGDRSDDAQHRRPRSPSTTRSVHLRVGQSVEATITSGATEREAVLVPHSAVVYVDGKPTVFVAEGDTRVRPSPCASARPTGRSTRSSKGVSDGTARRELRRLRAEERALPVSDDAREPRRIRDTQSRARRRPSRRSCSRSASSPRRRLPIDALPDVSSVQVDILTKCGGPLADRGRAHGHGPDREGAERRARAARRSAASRASASRRSPSSSRTARTSGARARWSSSASARRRATSRRRRRARARAAVDRARDDLQVRRSSPSSTRRCSSARCSTGRSARSSAACPASSR